MTCHRLNNAIVCLDERDYCDRCGCPDDQGAKLDKRGHCQDCQHERRERAAIKRAITREINRSIDAEGEGHWTSAYRNGLREALAILAERDKKERE
jgi:hypothetical protein